VPASVYSALVITSRGAGGWVGTDAADIDEYLAAYSAQGYLVQRVTHARCSACGSDTFHVRVDDEEGCAERTCVACGVAAFMLDSADYVEDADLGPAECPCGGQAFNVAVGFAVHDVGDPRWVYLGMRCAEDGLLGVYADWKIDYTPSSHLFASV
jgi:ribosomal protein L37E